MFDLSTTECGLLVLGGLLFACVVWFLLRNHTLRPPPFSRPKEDTPAEDQP